MQPKNPEPTGATVELDAIRAVPSGRVQPTASTSLKRRFRMRIIMILFLLIIGLPLLVMFYDRMRVDKKEILTSTGNRFEVYLRGGEWLRPPETQGDKLRLYAECAAFSEDVYDRKENKPSPEGQIEKPEGWNLVFPKSKEDPGLQMPEGSPALFSEEDSKFKGFAFKVWEDTRQDPIKIMIAFRGTDDRTDWQSNLRWVRKKLGGSDDQYDFVGKLAPQMIERLHIRFPGRRLRIIATGHSLGAGLAQHAAYAASEIKEVYCFDPSPVTGYYDIPEASMNAKGVKIDRIYERGEVLGYVRSLIRVFTGLDERDPNITEIGVNFARIGWKDWWNWYIKQHGMNDLAINLKKLSQ